MSRQKAPQLFSAGVLCGYDYFSTTSPFSSASTTRVPPDASVPSIRRSAAGSSTALRMVRRKSRAPKRPPWQKLFLNRSNQIKRNQRRRITGQTINRKRRHIRYQARKRFGALRRNITVQEAIAARYIMLIKR